MSQPNNNSSGPGMIQENPIKQFLRATEIDTRMLGMFGALILIWVGFYLYGLIFNGNGAFLTYRNLWNLSVQTSSIAVMATGMVLIIVTRHIDLSVGSMLGLTAMLMGVIQVWVLPNYLGLGHPMIWVITIICGLIIGTTIGTFQGFLIAYMEIPSFIVTLGGLSRLARFGLAGCPRRNNFTCRRDIRPYRRRALRFDWRHWLMDCRHHRRCHRYLHAYLRSPTTHPFWLPAASCLGRNSAGWLGCCTHSGCSLCCEPVLLASRDCKAIRRCP